MLKRISTFLFQCASFCLFTWHLFVPSFSYAQNADSGESLSPVYSPVYLSSREKVVIALALKARETTPEEKALLVSAMGEGIEAVSLKNQVVAEVKSFDEFLEYETGHQFFAHHDLADLSVEELLPKLQGIRVFSKDEKVQEQITAYHKRKRETRITLAGFLVFENLDLFRNVDSLNFADIEEKVRQKFEAYSTQVLNKFISTKDSAYVALLAKLLKMYFAALPAQQKNEIIFRISQLPFPSKLEDVFLTMVKFSGPQLQKLIQIVGRNEDIPLNFREIFQKLENQGAPVPWWKVRKLLEADGVGKMFSQMNKTPLGVGTMAQAHIADYNGHKVVVRFLKPGIAQRLQMDYEILIKLASELDRDPALKKYKLPSLSKLVDDIHASVSEELDIDHTIMNQKQGIDIYTRERIMSFDSQKNFISLSVPQVFKLAPTSKVMVQELIEGQKPNSEFKNYKELYPSLYKVVAEKLAMMWIEQAFFGSGFFHADLHQGNILVMITDPAVRVFLLDFGMVGRLNLQLQNSALLLALGSKSLNSELIAKHFLLLDKVKHSNQFAAQFLQKVRARVDILREKNESESSLERWTAWAMDQGLALNYEFLKLNRGIMALNGLLEDSHSSETLASLAEQVALQNKLYSSKVLMKEPLISLPEIYRLGLQVVEGSRLDFQPSKLDSQPTISRDPPISCQSLFRRK